MRATPNPSICHARSRTRAGAPVIDSESCAKDDEEARMGLSCRRSLSVLDAAVDGSRISACILDR